jgi:hypothetical protein
MLFGWKSARHLRRGLPKSELQKLYGFYQDYGLWQGWLERKEPGTDEPEHPADQLGLWEQERYQGGPNV